VLVNVQHLLSQLFVLSKSSGGKLSAVFLYGLTFVQILMYLSLSCWVVFSLVVLRAHREDLCI
jgi:hypothetical protein